ncbi:MAG TPA: carbohydrate ABC transporter permease [Thermomicrobiales bacterium]|nr:carbohydrate ABC transporter permease [Thermomicrobiales bacterium]
MAVDTLPVSGIQASQEDLDRIRASYSKGEKRNWTRMLGRFWFWVLIVIIVLYTLFPFYWAVVSSLTPTNDLYVTPVKFWPQNVTLDHYRTVFENSNFMRALLNSTIVSFSVVLMALLFGTLGAYALGRLHFRGRTIILYLILSMTMFPAIAILGSLFQIMQNTGAYNTLWGLVIVYLTFTLPFTVWVLTNFFRAMPAELEQAALVDGATPMQALRHILLPLAVPGMVTTALLAFIGAWSEYLYARTFTLTYDAKTVQVAIAEFSGNQQFELPFAVRMAAAVVVTVPLLVGVLIVQRRIIAGLTAGAVKG